jgi:hypothetical protein
MSDIDSEISSLENDSNSSKSTSSSMKRLLMLGGGSLVGGSILTLLIKPMWIYTQKVNRQTGEPETKIRWMRFLMSAILFAIAVFFGLKKVL